ncbi:MAG: hypothetical protein J6K95_05055 [Rikenellaceae bacterium]|nr:hypothetical protein [Rikenellaceae bacterium]
MASGIRCAFSRLSRIHGFVPAVSVGKHASGFAFALAHSAIHGFVPAVSVGKHASGFAFALLPFRDFRPHTAFLPGKMQTSLLLLSLIIIFVERLTF